MLPLLADAMVQANDRMVAMLVLAFMGAPEDTFTGLASVVVFLPFPARFARPP
jgi:hypothetical protein